MGDYKWLYITWRRCWCHWCFAGWLC